MNRFKNNLSKIVKWQHLLAFALLLLVVLSPVMDTDYEARIILTCVLFAGTLMLMIQYKHLLLYLLAFCIPLSTSQELINGSNLSLPSEMIAFLLSAFFILKIFTGSKIPLHFLKHPLTLFIMLDLVWLFISSVTSELPLVSFKRFLIRFTYSLSFYYFIYELIKSDQKNIKRIIYLHLAGLLTVALYTLYQQATSGFVMMGSQLLSRPFYFDHTIYGAALVFFIPFLFSQWPALKTLRLKWLSASFFLILLPAAYFSYSRAAWISLIIALVVYYLLLQQINKKLIFTLIGLFAVVYLFNGNKINNYFTATREISHTNDVAMHLKSVSNITTDVSNKERINRWKCAIRMFQHKPLFGFGPGTYQFSYGPFQLRSELTRISTFTGNKGHAHSEYLNYLSETGLPGLLIFIGLVFTAIKTALRIIRKKTEDKILTLGIFCGVLTYIIHAFFNGFLEFDKIAFPFFSSLAALCYLDLKQKINADPA